MILGPDPDVFLWASATMPALPTFFMEKNRSHSQKDVPHGFRHQVSTPQCPHDESVHAPHLHDMFPDIPQEQLMVCKRCYAVINMTAASVQQTAAQLEGEQEELLENSAGG